MSKIDPRAQLEAFVVTRDHVSGTGSKAVLFLRSIDILIRNPAP